jgi:hypothetical protein
MLSCFALLALLALLAFCWRKKYRVLLVQKYLPEKASHRGRGRVRVGGPQFTCFTGTNVQVLTQKALLTGGLEESTEGPGLGAFNRLVAETRGWLGGGGDDDEDGQVLLY